MQSRDLLVALLFAAGCDDTAFVPCGELTADWHGVQCTLNTHCVSCHSEPHTSPPVLYTVLPDDLIRDVVDGKGSLVVPGSPDESKLWRTLSGELDPELDQWGIMPWGYREPLPLSQIDHVRAWIEAGAVIEEDGL
jgi:hypothetical protein